MHDSAWYEPDDVEDDFGDDAFRRNLKPELSPDERILWQGRPCAPRMRKVAIVPAIFVVVLTSLSGLCLAAMLGVLAQARLNPGSLAVALGLAPLALGTLIAIDVARRSLAWVVLRRRLARTLYAVTDQRAIIARIGPADGESQVASLMPGMIEEITRFEYADGTGDLYFEGLEAFAKGPIGFFSIRGVRRVDELLRTTLIDPFPQW